MKKVLIIHAHPEENSFCSALSRKIESHFVDRHAEVRRLDLYQSSFDPVGGEGDFTQRLDDSYFKYQTEQVNAFVNDLFVPELKDHMNSLEWCDTVVFTFPLWWFGLPAILKGWVDRVFAMGFAYGNGKGVYENGVFNDKTAFLCFTTGGPFQSYGEDGKNGNLDKILYPIHHGMFYFTGMNVKPPFICFAPARMEQEERLEILSNLSEYLESVSEKENLF